MFIHLLSLSAANSWQELRPICRSRSETWRRAGRPTRRRNKQRRLWERKLIWRLSTFADLSHVKEETSLSTRTRGLSCFSVLKEESSFFAVFPYSCFFFSGIFLLFLFTCAIQGQSSVCFSHAPVWRGRVWRYNAQYISCILVHLLIFNVLKCMLLSPIFYV